MQSAALFTIPAFNLGLQRKHFRCIAPFNAYTGTQIATSAKQRKVKKESPEFRAITRHSGLFGGEQGIRTLEHPFRCYTISNRAPSASSDNSPYTAGAGCVRLFTLIQDLVVRGELIQLFLKLILGLLLRGGDGIMAGEATVAKTESGLLRKFVSRFYTKIPQAVNP